MRGAKITVELNPLAPMEIPRAPLDFTSPSCGARIGEKQDLRVSRVLPPPPHHSSPRCRWPFNALVTPLSVRRLLEALRSKARTLAISPSGVVFQRLGVFNVRSSPPFFLEISSWGWSRPFILSRSLSSAPTRKTWRLKPTVPSAPQTAENRREESVGRES